MKALAAQLEPGVIPFTPPAKALPECIVALISAACIAREDDRPLDQESERHNPWWGDPASARFPDSCPTQLIPSDLGPDVMPRWKVFGSLSVN
jgi:hypothetical protein